MINSLQVRYLDIEWLAPGRARSITVAPEPIEIERQLDGTWAAETQIFNGLCPWVGLHLGENFAHIQPTFEYDDGRLVSMRRITDALGCHWWVQEHGWDATKNRHLSELHRSMGQFTIWLGEQCLKLNNIVDDIDRATVEDYLSDFQHELIWLVMGFGGATATRNGATMDKSIVEALEAFASASNQVLKQPAQNIYEISVRSQPGRLRPNASTFREFLRNPSAKRLPGRGAQETADIADNQHLRFMVQVCEKIASYVAAASECHADVFSNRAKAEASRKVDYQTRSHRQIDPDVFDHQMRDLEKKLEQVKNFKQDIREHHESFSIFKFRPGKPYGTRGDQMFYENINGRPSKDKNHNFHYSVLQVPSTLAAAIQATRRFCDHFEIAGAVRVTKQEAQNGKGYREANFYRIYKVTPITSALTRKAKRRQQLEKNGWLAPLTSKEHQELQQEAETAHKRERVYREQAQMAEKLARLLRRFQEELRAQDTGWHNLGVTPNPQLPMGVRFSQSSMYATCQAAYTKVIALATNQGLGFDEIEAIEKIGVLHASALYERWCLVKIISILMEDYEFTPEVGWQELLIGAVTGQTQSVTLRFRRDDVKWSATLEIQPELRNGRRPDFRLRFKTDESDSTGGIKSNAKWTRPIESQSSPTELNDGLVMDAKFRTKWRRNELGRMLFSLVQEKKYDLEGDRVFILHPAPNSIQRPTSPLYWGRNSDYGQESGVNHRKGVIHLAPGTGDNSPEQNLRRLIVLMLQANLPAPSRDAHKTTDQDEVHSFCIRCGKAYESSDIKSHLTQKGNEFWVYTCTGCSTYTTRTHCFGCGDQVLFKNGLQLTYHKTVADQVTNIICPSCGEYFDNDVHNSG